MVTLFSIEINYSVIINNSTLKNEDFVLFKFEFVGGNKKKKKEWKTLQKKKKKKKKKK